MKSARSEDFKTVLDFQFWPSRSWDIGVRTHQGSFSVFTLLGNFKSYFCVISTKNFLKYFFNIFFVEIWLIWVENITENNMRCQIEVFRVQKSDQTCWICIISCKKCKNWKWPLVCSNPNISASTWPKLKIKDSFEILRTSRFQNWPSFLNLVKIWGRYCQKTNWELFCGHGV